MTEIETNGKRRKTVFKLALFLIVISLICLLYWFFFLRNKQNTDDAYVNGYTVNLTSEISAITTAFFADDTDFVKKGTLLVELDKTNYQLKFEEEKANLALAVRQVVQLQQNVWQAKADLKAQRLRAERAEIDFQNREGLVDLLAITKEDYQHARIDVDRENALVSHNRHQLKAAISALGTTTLENHPLVENAKSMLRQAYINLTRTAIYAPVDGFVAKRVVEVGKWVNPKDPLMALISLDDVWVDANFKETQLMNIRIGQPVNMVTDIYGSQIPFKGEVLGIVPGSGSVFSLLPPQNATGNWIKIVQRVPVRIKLDREELRKNPLLLGLSVDVTIDTTDTTGNFLALVSKQEAIVTTSIYNISMEKIDQLILSIINENKL